MRKRAATPRVVALRPVKMAPAAVGDDDAASCARLPYLDIICAVPGERESRAEPIGAAQFVLPMQSPVADAPAVVPHYPVMNGFQILAARFQAPPSNPLPLSR